ncbi:unnamed protein product [Lepeophtheirus salmonis]|uniref:(salmon louse) hypothetical protein n=1 Tax=Lepeophtheirus salmonis TaxID=72036 RepID=A0A7R8H719_LEPSM|nr:unnamed protein product [Lepeophtheirus salmonis]CAF2911727.1 unnamed protein product [Lepeophtheirus salmonis]
MEATIDGNKPGRNQFIAAFLTAALGSTSIGAVFGFSAILLPQMEVEFQLDSKSEEASWIAILGWLLIGISDGNFVIIIFGRILGGIGLISTVSQMYLVEIADSNNRGQFGALLNWRTVLPHLWSATGPVYIVLFALQQWTGSYAVIFYSVNIFKDVGISGNGLEYIPSILKLGRRTLLIISSGIADKWMLLLPALEVIMYILAYGIGLGIVPWILIGELCTTELKGVISGIATCSCYLNIFLTVKLFPQSILSIGSHGTFLVFAVFCLASIIFAVF